MPKITRPKMARASALARADRSEPKDSRKSGDAPTYRCAAKIPPKWVFNLKGLYNSGPSGSTEPRERSEYLSQGLPHIKYIYLCMCSVFPHKRGPLLPRGARAARVILLAAGADFGDL